MTPVEESFDWDQANIAHLARHGISPQEAEEVIHCSPAIVNTELRLSEIRRKEIGETLTGRVLIVVSIARGYRIRVVTAWQAGQGARAEWQREKEGREDEFARTKLQD